MESYLRDELEKQAKSLKAPPHPQVNAGFWHHREHSEMWSMPWHLTAGGILGNIHSIGEECRVCSICLSNITANIYCEQNDEIFPLFTTFQSLFFFISAEKKKKSTLTSKHGKKQSMIVTSSAATPAVGLIIPLHKQHF